MSLQSHCGLRPDIWSPYFAFSYFLCKVQKMIQIHSLKIEYLLSDFLCFRRETQPPVSITESSIQVKHEFNFRVNTCILGLPKNQT